jgi:hypothetical protein
VRLPAPCSRASASRACRVREFFATLQALTDAV